MEITRNLAKAIEHNSGESYRRYEAISGLSTDCKASQQSSYDNCTVQQPENKYTRRADIIICKITPQKYVSRIISLKTVHNIDIETQLEYKYIHSTFTLTVWHHIYSPARRRHLRLVKQPQLYNLSSSRFIGASLLARGNMCECS